MSTYIKTIVLTATAACSVMAPYYPASAAGKGSTTSINNPALARGSAFGALDKVYTREEILKAKPLQWTPAPAGDGRYQSNGAGFREEPPQVKGRPKSALPGLPNPNADRDAKSEFADQWQLLEEIDRMEKEGLLDEQPAGGTTTKNANFASGVDFGTQNIYTGYRGNYWLNQQTAFPWKVVGKLLIDGGGYCTAQSITGAPKNIVVTAAHCVYDPGVGFKRGWTFVPAERFGAAPYGQFRWASARVLNAWMSSGGRRNDVAIIRLQNNSAGRPVSYYTGWLGWRQNYPYVRSLHSIGYASNIATTWTSMCAAESFYASCEGTDVLVKGCNMTFGSSGGAWIDVYKPYEVAGYVESVVSGPSCAGSVGQTYVGARFSSANIGTLCSAEGGCTTP
ncbi:MAG: hypothetical protein H6R26_1304 [Proteobacteria bacterium]|nr:hypothetical protein [Pseudomonadota bacterium]